MSVVDVDHVAGAKVSDAASSQSGIGDCEYLRVIKEV